MAIAASAPTTTTSRRLTKKRDIIEMAHVQSTSEDTTKNTGKVVQSHSADGEKSIRTSRDVDV